MGTAELHLYHDALIVLATAGVIIPVMHRYRITPVLGYLAAGALLGPHGLGALASQITALSYISITSEAELRSIAELGVVFLMFVIGLELSIERLTTMRRLVFGLGGLQMVLTAVAIGLTAPLFGNSAAASVLIGASLALSSTAVVVEWLSQRKRLGTSAGRAAFSVLLLQDLAVVPILVMTGLLGQHAGGPLVLELGKALFQATWMLAFIVIGGRILLRPLFRLVASADSPELFMAATLLVAIGSAVLTAGSGLSMALGGFVAGLLLAETEYRKAVDAVIQPFKGLLIGVFFISIGMRIDVVTLAREPIYLLACAVGTIAIKVAIMAPLARRFGLSWGAATEAALLLGPGGEFAFIVISISVAQGIIMPNAASLLLAVVALTMALIPAVGIAGERFSAWIKPPAPAPAALAETPPTGRQVHAIVVGAGRVGRVVSRLLSAHGVEHVLTDRDPGAVVSGREDGHIVYYGDAKNPAFLKSCGLGTARAVIVTIHSGPEIDEVVDVVHSMRPAMEIIARARDGEHARKLYKRGVTDAVPETIEASLQLSEAALVALGQPAGPVIASIHEQRDVFRRELQKAAGTPERPVRGLRAARSKEAG